jgi:BMFP domain-containing protein YqiC
MTRRDLEEAIVSLEYLVLNHLDAIKREEYAQQLEAFRVQLQALNQQHYSLTLARSSNLQHRRN